MLVCLSINYSKNLPRTADLSGRESVVRVGSEVRDSGSEKCHHVTHEVQEAAQADGRMKKEQSAGNKAVRQRGLRAYVSPTEKTQSQDKCKNGGLINGLTGVSTERKKAENADGEVGGVSGRHTCLWLT